MVEFFNKLQIEWGRPNEIACLPYKSEKLYKSSQVRSISVIRACATVVCGSAVKSATELETNPRLDGKMRFFQLQTRTH